jgi:ABC-2 type transport system ATP-binding protein
MPAISFQSVSKAYPSPRGPKGATFLALDDVSLVIEEGEFFGLLGPNGAGKTTLISILAGLTRASQGTVSVLGSNVQSDFAEARRKLGVVPQELVFDPFFNVREMLRIQSGYFGVKNNDAWVDELLEGLGLTDKANANMRQLSGGMKRRVLVAQALVHRPPVIVLDEPTAGVDVELRQTLWQFVAKLNKQGHTVLLTTHYLEEAEALCGRIAMLKSGKLVRWTPRPSCSRAHQAMCFASRLIANFPSILRTRRGSRAVLCSFRHTTPPRSSSTLPPFARRACKLKTWRSARPTWRMCSSMS